jgi:intein/homing endonuclease
MAIRFCNACRNIVKCPTCNRTVTGFKHVGVRGAGQPSGIWHYAVPCGHRYTPSKQVLVSKAALAVYNGGPLWQAGYKWQNVYWGTYWNQANIPFTRARVDKATAYIEADQSYSGGLSEYNVGQGSVLSSVVIGSDPPQSVDDSQIGGFISQWIKAGLIQELGQKGAYNIFFPPGVVVTLSGDQSCASFCDYHNFDGTHFYTVEPYPCESGCNQCTSSQFDTLSQGLSEEMIELQTDMNPGTGWVIGNEELCDYCLPPNELLLGDNKTILEMRVGGHVVGKEGLQDVTKTYERKYKGNLLEIKAEGMLPLRVTPNHPLLVVREKHFEVRDPEKQRYIDSLGHWRNRYHVIQKFSEPVWKRADQLIEKHSSIEGDCLLLPRIKGTIEANSIPLTPYMKHPKYFSTKHLLESFPLNKETSWLLGLYVAEGSTNGVHQISCTLGEHEIPILEKAQRILSELGIQSWVREVRGENCIVLYFNSRPMLRMLNEICGRGANNKRIPDIILYNKNSELLSAFLEGYYEGDGYGNGSYRILVTVSKLLIQQLQLGYARLGYFLKVNLNRTGRSETIQGREVETHDKYRGSLLLSPMKEEYTRSHGEYFFVPIRSIQRVPYAGKVYNIGTNDHTYLVSNAIIHNCDANFKCNQISTGEYVNSWYSNRRNACWVPK